MMLDDLKVLLREYISRQQLVYDILQELRPHFFAVHDKSVSGIDLVNLVRQGILHVPFTGTWQKYGTWKYYIHGAGCRLTNMISGEVIEWDTPHVTDFDLKWFMNWINWVKNVNHTYQSVTEDVVYNLLNQLEQEGVVERPRPSHIFLFRYVDNK